MRIRDIPRKLIQNNYDLGIVGKDILLESQEPLIELSTVGYGACRVGLSVRQDVPYARPSDLEGKIVSTSYPHITQDFFDTHNVKIDLHECVGSVELDARLGKADAVMDAIDTGESLRTNGLELKELLFDSTAYLVANPSLREQKQKRELVEEFFIRSFSYLRPKYQRWITMNVPIGLKEVILNTLEPYSASPTVSLCENSDMLDIASIIPTNKYWGIIYELRAKGARDIAELTIKRSILNGNDYGLKRMMNELYPGQS
jgi:ATP phosphoribosyltransferase